MSKRAIVRATDEQESYSIYCHGDGYPSFLGKKIKELCDKAKMIDVNQEPREPYEKVDYDKPDWHQTRIPNVSSEACKFMAVLIGELWKEYGGVYLTQRDAEKEAKEDWTDIEHLYEVKLKGGKNPKVIWKKHDYKTKSFIVKTQKELQEAIKEQRE